MEMTVLMNTIKYPIKECENGRNGQNAGNIWAWTGPAKFNIVTLNGKKKKKKNPKGKKKCIIHDNHVSWQTFPKPVRNRTLLTVWLDIMRQDVLILFVELLTTSKTISCYKKDNYFILKSHTIR